MTKCEIRSTFYLRKAARRKYLAAGIISDSEAMFIIRNIKTDEV
jgi:hypothetical protein